MERRPDARTRRTREALLGAFNRLVLVRRQRRIAVRDIVAEAEVGRSTFYEHYSSADELHLEALGRIFAILADAAMGRGEFDRVVFLLDHFWQNRDRARESFAGKLEARATRMLADMIEERLSEAPLAIASRLAALQLAEAMLAPTRAWLTGAASATPQALAASLCATGAAMARALRVPEAP